MFGLVGMHLVNLDRLIWSCGIVASDAVRPPNTLAAHANGIRVLGALDGAEFS